MAADWEEEPRPAAGPMDLEDQEAQKPLLVTAPGRIGDGSHLAESDAAPSSSSIAVVVASTAVAVAGSFEFGISVTKAFRCSFCYIVH